MGRFNLRQYIGSRVNIVKDLRLELVQTGDGNEQECAAQGRNWVIGKGGGDSTPKCGDQKLFQNITFKWCIFRAPKSKMLRND